MSYSSIFSWEVCQWKSRPPHIFYWNLNVCWMTLQWNDIDAAFAFHSLCRSNRNDHRRLAAHSGVWGQCLRSGSKWRESASGPDSRHQYVTRAHLLFSKSDLVLRHLNALCMAFAIIHGVKPTGWSVYMLSWALYKHIFSSQFQAMNI